MGSAKPTKRPVCDPLEPRLLMAATPKVTSFTLINADTDQPVVTMPALSSGAVLDLSTLPTKRLNVRANVTGAVGSVKFGYDGNAKYRIENGAPYAFASNNGADYFAWTPTIGSHTIRATPFSAANAAGIAGVAFSVNFTVASGVVPWTPIVSLTASDPTAKETGGDNGTITVARTGPTGQPLTVSLIVGGTATEGSDYQTLPRTATIPAGSTFTTLTVRALADTDAEPAETIQVNLAPGAGYTSTPSRSSATVTIAADGTGTPTPTPTPIPAPTPGFTVSASQAGPTGLSLSWNAPSAAVAKYRITYTAGDYVPGPGGQPQTVEVDGSTLSAGLTGLQPFTFYSVDVTALDSASSSAAAAHMNAITAATSTYKRYLYAFDLPKKRQGFDTLKPQIEVFDITNGHQWVRNIPLPTGIYNVRGVAGSAATNRIYVSYHAGPYEDYSPGGILCLNATTGQLMWRRDYPQSVVPSPDRLAITPDGAKIYMPVGENGSDDFWVVIDAANGNPLGKIHHVSAPHNTNVSIDGRYVFLEGQEKGPQQAGVAHTIAVVDTTTDTVIRRVGPFQNVLRPFTINGKANLIYATMNNLVGFQIGDVATGKVLYTATPPGIAQPDPTKYVMICHGIAITPDEREVWVVDTARVGIHVWDVSNVATGVAPKYVGFIKTRRTGRDLAGNPDPAASNDTNGVPAWITASYDGKYMYPESGEIIDVATHKVVGQLRPKATNSAGQLVNAAYTHSRFMMEVDVDGGAAVRVTNQFGVGRVR